MSHSGGWPAVNPKLLVMRATIGVKATLLSRSDHAHRVALMTGPTGRQAVRALLHPRWLPYSIQLLNNRSLAYRASFGGSAAGFDDSRELTRYDVEDPSGGAVSRRRMS